MIDRKFIREEEIQIFYYDNLFEQLLQDGNIIENKFGYFKNSMLSNINKLNLEVEVLWSDFNEG